MMPQIYISYRAIDSHQKAVAQLHQQLAGAFGAENISLSQDYSGLSTADLQARVRQHDVVLVVFGRYGLDMVDEAGIRLLTDPYDPIHVEIDAGLRAGLVVKTLLFDESLDDLTKHLPDVLRPLTTHSVVKVSSTAELPTVTEALIKELARVQKRNLAPPSAKPDLSKMVMQPSRHSVPIAPLSEANTQPEPANSFQPTLLQSAGRTGSMIIFALIVIVGLVIALISNLRVSKHLQNENYEMTRVMTVEQGAYQVTFADNRPEVAYASTGNVWLYNWQTIPSPEQIRVGLFPEQVLYSTDNRIVVRDNYRIYVIEIDDYGNNSTYKFLIDNTYPILDMIASPTEPIVYFVVQTGDLVYWNYETGERITQKIGQAEFLRFTDIALSTALNQLAVIGDKQVYLWELDTLESLGIVLSGSFDFPAIFIAFDDEGKLIVVTETHVGHLSWNSVKNEWQYPGYRPIEETEPPIPLDNLYRDDLISYQSEHNRLMIATNKHIHVWELDYSLSYLGSVKMPADVGFNQAIAGSSDGDSIVTATTNSVIIWEFSYTR